MLPNGIKYPSVTTILSALDTKWLERWKARVGEEAAAEISGMAKTRGTAIHNLAEKYLMNDPDWWKGSMSINLSNFKKIREHLDRNVGEIYGIEMPLHSHVLKTAGTTDLIAMWKNTPAIVDFKTARNPKKEENIEHYFIQATVYSEMVKERFGLEINKIAIVMIVDHSEPLIFEKDPSDYLDRVNDIFVRNRPMI